MRISDIEGCSQCGHALTYHIYTMHYKVPPRFPGDAEEFPGACRERNPSRIRCACRFLHKALTYETGFTDAS